MKIMLNITRRLCDEIGINNDVNRNNWVKQTLQKIPKGYRILDAGAGTLKYKEFCSHLHYVSQDLAKYDGKGDNVGLQVEQFNYGTLDIISDIINIPEHDESFDAILCTEVLEHIPSPELAIKEFARLIKDGGYLILTAPYCSLTHFSPYHYFSGFNIYFYKYNLSKYGFKIIEIERNGNYYEYIAQEILRLQSIALKYSGIKFNIFNKCMIVILLLILKKLNLRDNGSSELLCFGYHLLAQRNKGKNSNKTHGKS